MNTSYYPILCIYYIYYIFLYICIYVCVFRYVYIYIYIHIYIYTYKLCFFVYSNIVATHTHVVCTGFTFTCPFPAGFT